MRNMGRKTLQDRYVAALVEVNLLSPELARYHAERASDEQMEIHLAYAKKFSKSPHNLKENTQ